MILSVENVKFWFHLWIVKVWRISTHSPTIVTFHDFRSSLESGVNGENIMRWETGTDFSRWHLPVTYDVISGCWIPVLGRSSIAFQGQNWQAVVLSIDTRLKENSLSKVKLNGVIILSVWQDVAAQKTKTFITNDYCLCTLKKRNFFDFHAWLWLAKQAKIIYYLAINTMITLWSIV